MALDFLGVTFHFEWYLSKTMCVCVCVCVSKPKKITFYILSYKCADWYCCSTRAVSLIIIGRIFTDQTLIRQFLFEFVTWRGWGMFHQRFFHWNSNPREFWFTVTPFLLFITYIYNIIYIYNCMPIHNSITVVSCAKLRGVAAGVVISSLQCRCKRIEISIEFKLRKKKNR